MSLAKYDAIRARLTFLFDSYIGGDQYKNPSSNPLSTARIYGYSIDSSTGDLIPSIRRTYASYLIPRDNESEREFEARISYASYNSLCRFVVDSYAEAVTTKVQRKFGDLAGFATKVDYKGRSWGSFVESIAKFTATYGFMFTVVDANESGPKAIPVHPTQIAWIDVDGYTGDITEFAWIEDAYYADAVSPSSQSIKVRVYNKDGWSIRCGTVQNVHAGLTGVRDKLQPIESGALPERLNGKLPIVVSYYEEDTTNKWPFGYSLIDNIADIARQIYNDKSRLAELTVKAPPFLAIPQVKSGGALTPQTKQAIGLTKGFGHDSGTGGPAWVVLPPEYAASIRDTCEALKTDALQQVGLAVNASAQVQSGEALRVGSREFDSRAARYANQMCQYEEQLKSLFCLFAGVSDKNITITYPNKFTLPDLKEDIINAKEVLALNDIDLVESAKTIGVDATVKAAMQIVCSALNVSDIEASAFEKEMRASLSVELSDVQSERIVRGLLLDKKAREWSAPVEVPGTTPADPSSADPPEDMGN